MTTSIKDTILSWLIALLLLGIIGAFEIFATWGMF